MTLRVEPVRGWRSERAFLSFPYRLHAGGETPWVPPLRRSARDLVDTRRNPFYREARLGRFIARRGSEMVGRIGAIENPAHNRFHRDRVGFFGFFECRNDPEAAAALLDAAADWLRQRDLHWMRGPMSPSTNHECGLLVDGYEHPPVLMTTWNAPYYLALLEGWGLGAERDLLGFRIPFPGDEPGLHARVARLADRARARSDVTVREVRLDRFPDEVAVCWDIYAEAWAGNWGYVPLSKDEFFHIARDLRSIVDPRLGLVAESGGVPAGFLLAVPDLNRVLGTAAPDGRLFPLGFLRLQRQFPRVRTGRALTLGVKREFRARNVLPLLLDEVIRRAGEWGAEWGEASWILEENQRMIRAIEAIGGREYRRWRILGAPLDSTAAPPGEPGDTALE